MSEAHRVRVARPSSRAYSRYHISEARPGPARACSIPGCDMVEWYDTMAGRIGHDYYARHSFRPPLSELRLVLPEGDP